MSTPHRTCSHQEVAPSAAIWECRMVSLDLPSSQEKLTIQNFMEKLLFFKCWPKSQMFYFLLLFFLFFVWVSLTHKSHVLKTPCQPNKAFLCTVWVPRTASLRISEQNVISKASHIPPCSCPEARSENFHYAEWLQWSIVWLLNLMFLTRFWCWAQNVIDQRKDEWW